MPRKVTVADTLDMSVAERIELVQDIWDSVAASASAVPLEDSERAEIERRLGDREQNPGPTISWEEAKQRLLGGR